MKLSGLKLLGLLLIVIKVGILNAQDLCSSSPILRSVPNICILGGGLIWILCPETCGFSPGNCVNKAICSDESICLQGDIGIYLCPVTCGFCPEPSTTTEATTTTTAEATTSTTTQATTTTTTEATTTSTTAATTTEDECVDLLQGGCAALILGCSAPSIQQSCPVTCGLCSDSTTTTITTPTTPQDSTTTTQMTTTTTQVSCMDTADPMTCSLASLTGACANTAATDECRETCLFCSRSTDNGCYDTYENCTAAIATSSASVCLFPGFVSACELSCGLCTQEV